MAGTTSIIETGLTYNDDGMVVIIEYDEFVVVDGEVEYP